jgi:hypothetical protein
VKRRPRQRPTPHSKAFYDELVRKARRGAYAKSSRDNLRSSVKGYVTWCRSVARRPLPATAAKVCAFATFYCVVQGYKATNLPSIACRLQRWALDKGSTYLDTRREQDAFTQTVRGLKRRDPRPPKRVRPLLMEHMNRIARKLNFNDVRHIQWWLALIISHQACLRSASTTGEHLRLGGIEFTAQGMELTLRQHKTSLYPSQLGFAKRGDVYDAPSLMRRYLRLTGLGKLRHSHPNAMLFPKLPSGGGRRKTHTWSTGELGIRAWSYGSWVKQLRFNLQRAGVAGWRAFAGHSPRAGGACDYLSAGVSAYTVARIGRWKSVDGAFRVYDRRPASEVSAAVQRLGANTGVGEQQRQQLRRRREWRLQHWR